MILINDEKNKIKQMVVPPENRCILLSAMKTPLMLLIYAWCFLKGTHILEARACFYILEANFVRGLF